MQWLAIESHNLKVGSSNLPPATTKNSFNKKL